MTRRLHDCSRCGGQTRHADQRCAACRRSGRSGLLFGGQTRVTILRDPPRDLRAPTVAELNAGFDISARITVDWGYTGDLERWRFTPVADVRLAEIDDPAGGEVVHVDFSGRDA